jgi:stage V sporulation protein R
MVMPHGSRSKFMIGSPVLMGNNTIPGVELPTELKVLLPTIFKAVSDFGCDYYPAVVQKLTYDEISEICAYDGFPVRFPHWKWGMEYEEMQKRYEHGLQRVYELVVNTYPGYIYCLDSNTLVDDVTVVAHALGHLDFFKNNIYFSHTSQNMMNELANHGTRIRRYMSRWGKEKVTEFINHVLRIETLIDPTKAWERKKVKNPIVKDSREYKHPRRLKVAEGHDYMEEYINPEEWTEKQHRKIEREEIAQQLDLFTNSTKDIMRFIRDYAPLKPWQSDIVAMLYEEAMYFAPQRTTKTLNEGWASYIDYNIIAKQGLAALGQNSGDSAGIVEYATHKMGVLGGKYSMNPYKLGFYLLLDIEERWNKGQFGTEWEECKDIRAKKDWDKQLGLGLEKVFEVRKYYNDTTALLEFFTADFCEKYEFFEWKKYPNGETRIENRDPVEIKKKLIQKHINGGLPEIKLVDCNYKGKGVMLLEHVWDGRTLYDSYTRATLQSLYYLWKNDVMLTTRNSDGREIVYYCVGDGDNDVGVIYRDDYEKKGVVCE